MFGLRVRTLRDEARVLGFVLPKGYEFDLDITPEQAQLIQDAVDAGMIEVLKGAEVLPTPAPAPVIEPPPPPKAEKGKGK